MQDIQRAFFRHKKVPRHEESLFRFVFDGARLLQHQTAGDHDMQEEDSIDVFREMSGGCE